MQAQQVGETLSLSELARREPGAEDDRLALMLGKLSDARLARGDEEGHWVLIRDAGTLTLLDLYRAGGFGLPMPSEEPVQDDAWNRALFDALSALTEPAERHLGGPLENLYKG